jgi:2-(1,2-epoxy-1,2-dihydrophenyl)acetyl-CoA isomerase
MSSAYESVDGLDIELRESVLTLRLARPDKRNALDDTMVYAAIDAVDLAGRDESVRAILLTGEGEHFCSGFDWVARNRGAAKSGTKPRVGSIQRRLPSQAHRLIPLLCTVQVPVVCAVRGWAAGIGLNLALAADFTVAAVDARFWAPFVDRGFTPDSGATWLLPRRVGDVRAREMIHLGRVIDGAEAVEWNMIHRAVPPDEVDATVGELVTKLAASPTVGLGLAKWLLHVGATTPLDEHLRNEAFAMELSSRSEDFREGLKAFGEKRPPEFGGR